MPKYTPVMNEPVRSCLGLQHRYDAYKPRKVRSFEETPQMNTMGVPIANPITKGDRSTGRGRYEKGRMDKSRS